MREVIAKPSVTRKILKDYNIKLNKKLGQNMLVDRNILDIIVEASQFNENDLVVEIGPGIGSLTQIILNNLSGGLLLAIEKDTRFIKILKELFAGDEQLEIVNRDVLEIDWCSFLSEEREDYNQVKVTANLPYYITSPTIMGLLESDVFFSRLVFLVQKEVAERIVAGPGTKKYGSLSVAVQYYGKPEIIHCVSPAVFYPRPRVDSCIISVKPFRENPYQVIYEDFFFRVVKTIFQQRRKNIKNAFLKGSIFNIKKDLIIKALEQCGIKRTTRGEKLLPEEMMELSNILWQLKKESSDN